MNPWVNYDYEGLNEKDNTSASETSKSLNTDAAAPSQKRFIDNNSVSNHQHQRNLRRNQKSGVPFLPSAFATGGSKTPFDEVADEEELTASANAAVDVQN